SGLVLAGSLSAQAAEFIPLGVLPGDSSSWADGVSADGSVVVGVSSFSTGWQAFRWTQGGGMTGLGVLPGGSESWAFGVSADGSVVVGRSDSNTGDQAFIWDQSRGMRSLLDVLIADYGLGSQVTGWRLERATAISPDGRHIVGWGFSPNGTEGWLVRNLNPVPLPAAAYLFGAGLAGLAGLARRRS
ncbi:MAG: VPLPA-CTERM sorting domain-containing protein, partial [Nitrospira sp.]|nr:VPLPA-CTERM sorting domain-containing protein [Nitrospira sp.]